MLTVEMREEIRRAHFIEGKGVRQIAREGGYHRKTVRKAIREAGPPRYTMGRERGRPALGLLVGVIDRWLAEDQQQPPKQRHTARRIYMRLVEEHGFTGGESTVRAYVREHRPTRSDRFIPLAYEPGEDAQVDFGEAEIVLGGKRMKAQVFFIRLCFSKLAFVMAFPHQRQEAFLEGHVQAFGFFGGAPRVIWYDNLSQAVKSTLVGRKRQEQEAFTAFRSHYLFQSRFCTPGEGHEKGLVENLVGYGRRNFMVPVPEVDSFQELNALLWERCLAEAERKLRGQPATVGEMWAQERPRLLGLPERDFPCCRTVTTEANRLSLVRFETNRYSVPVEESHAPLLLRAFVDRVEISNGKQLLASHARSYGREQDALQVLHYLPLLRERPGALDHAKPVKQWDRPEALDRYLEVLRERLPHRRATLQFLDVVELARTHPLEKLGAAVEKALQCGSLGPETVAYFLRAERNGGHPQPEPLADAPACPAVQERDLGQYDLLVRRSPEAVEGR